MLNRSPDIKTFTYRHSLAFIFKAFYFIVPLTLLVGFAAVWTFNFTPLAMRTGSMNPTLPIGSLVIDKKVDPISLKKGDIISFYRPGSRLVVTHRIWDIVGSKNARVFKTKGDANSIPDPWVIAVAPNQKAEKQIFALPYAGYVLVYASTPIGWIILTALLILAVFGKNIFASSPQAKTTNRQPSETSIPDFVPAFLSTPYLLEEVKLTNENP